MFPTFHRTNIIGCKVHSALQSDDRSSGKISNLVQSLRWKWSRIWIGFAKVAVVAQGPASGPAEHISENRLRDFISFYYKLIMHEFTFLERLGQSQLWFLVGRRRDLWQFCWKIGAFSFASKNLTISHPKDQPTFQCWKNGNNLNFCNSFWHHLYLCWGWSRIEWRWNFSSAKNSSTAANSRGLAASES